MVEVASAAVVAVGVAAVVAGVEPEQAVERGSGFRTAVVKALVGLQNREMALLVGAAPSR